MNAAIDALRRTAPDVARNGLEWFEASIYAEGSDAFRDQLSSALGSSILVGLAASTDFTSRILWPAALAGWPLFTFTPVTASGFLRRLKLTLLPQNSHSLSPDALSAIKQSA